MPAMPAMFAIPAMPAWLAYAIALAASLVLAAFLTPKSWWRRPNLKALAVLGAGTWGIGALLLAAAPERAEAHVAQVAQVAQRPIATSGPAFPAQASYRVFEDLNLRAAAGVGARRLALVPAGSSVITTGAREGDWWQVRTVSDTGPNEEAAPAREGWVSSLWLRRAEEAKQGRFAGRLKHRAGPAG